MQNTYKCVCEIKIIAPVGVNVSQYWTQGMKPWKEQTRYKQESFSLSQLGSYIEINVLFSITYLSNLKLGNSL